MTNAIGPAAPAPNDRRSARGSAVLETALVLPLLLALTLGLVETGYLVFAQATVGKAAQAGTRLAVTGKGHDDGTSLDLIRARARETASVLSAGTLEVSVRSYPGLDPAATATENDPGLPCHLVEVEVGYAYPPITPLAGWLFPETISVAGKERMVVEPWMPCK